MIDSEATYLMARARREAELAVQAKHPAAAAAHRGLSLRYSAQAAIDIALSANDGVDDPRYERAESA